MWAMWSGDGAGPAKGKPRRGSRLQSAHCMKHVKKSVLLWYSPREMYDLVTAIADYPSFLPWCDRAEVLEQHDEGVTARLGLATWACANAFTTRNEHVPGESVLVRLVDGPVLVLDAPGSSAPLGRPGSEAQACKIEFDLRYAFSSPALEVVVSPCFRQGGQHLRRLVRQAGRRCLRPPLARSRSRWCTARGPA